MSGPWKKRRNTELDDPTAMLEVGQVRRVSRKKPKRAGKKDRKTILLQPDVIDYIADLSNENEIGVMAMYEWLLHRGLQAWEDGERPVVQQSQVTAHKLELNWQPGKI